MSNPIVIIEWGVRRKGWDGSANTWPLDQSAALKFLTELRTERPNVEWELVSRTVTTTEWETHNA